MISRSKENYGAGRKTTSLVLGLCEFHQGYFQTNYTLEINQKLVSGDVRKLLLRLSRENSTAAITNILHFLL